MNINYKKKGNNNSILMAILLFITILVFMILMIIYISNNKKENFANPHNFNNTIIQSGVSGISSSGNIMFDTKYKNPPQVFTQIIGNQSVSSNMYSIIIFDVTNTGFSYIKNMASNDISKSNGGNSFSVVRLKTDDFLQFNWISIGQ